MKYIPSGYHLTEKDKQIANAQAWNLAVAILPSIIPPIQWDEDLLAKERLEYWQGFFYEKLTEPFTEQTKEENKIRTGKSPQERAEIAHEEVVTEIDNEQ